LKRRGAKQLGVSGRRRDLLWSASAGVVLVSGFFSVLKVFFARDFRSCNFPVTVIFDSIKVRFHHAYKHVLAVCCSEGGGGKTEKSTFAPANPDAIFFVSVYNGAL
jgi:hypothetical protein